MDTSANQRGIFHGRMPSESTRRDANIDEVLLPLTPSLPIYEASGPLSTQFHTFSIGVFGRAGCIMGSFMFILLILGILHVQFPVSQSQTTTAPSSDRLLSIDDRKFRQPPNVVVFFADDLGRADVGYCEGNLQTPTPNIDKLANDGVIMDRYYTNSICTPSRAAFMSGKYVFQTGMAYNAVRSGEPWGLPPDLKILPGFLKDLNYSTNFLGKWHLGSHTRAYHPDHRGFDYWLGVTQGSTNAFNYTTGTGQFGSPYQSARDLYENGRQVPVNHTNNHYFPDMILEKAEQIIRNADPAKPFYIHFATTLPRKHDEYNTQCQPNMPRFQLKHPVRDLLNDTWIERKKQLAAIQAMDEQVERLIAALEVKGVLHNTLFAFMSDNGAPDLSNFNKDAINHGSNWPLRLGKTNYFEGGVRAPCFIWYPKLKRRGYIANRLMHVTDWLPTLYEAAGGSELDLASYNLSGVSHWSNLKRGVDKPGPRHELVNTIENVGNQYAMIEEDNTTGVYYKLIGGEMFSRDRSFLGWVRTEGTTEQDPMQVFTPTQINCSYTYGMEQTACVPWNQDCLFDLTNDPCEQTNLAAVYPDVLARLQEKLKVYNSTAVPANNVPVDPAAKPSLWGGWWVPWLDPVPVLPPIPYAPFNPSSSY